MRHPKNLNTKLALSFMSVACLTVIAVTMMRLAQDVSPRQQRLRPVLSALHTDDRCLRSVQHRSTQVDGPARVLAVSGDSPQYERLNVAFFNAGKEGRACSRYEVPTFSRPSNPFVEHAYRICRALAHAEHQHTRLAIQEANDFLLGRRFVSLGAELESDPRGRRQLLCYLYFASNYSGHPFELAMDGFGALLDAMLRSHWDLVTVLHHNYASAGHPFAADYLRLLKAAVTARGIDVRFVEISLVDPVTIVLHANASLTYVSPMFGTTPCQAVAQGLWASLLPTLPFQGTRACEKCLILKTNSALRHSTPLFFSLDRSSNALGGYQVVPEDVPKERRLWLLHTANIIVDSFGANAEIDRLLLVPIVPPEGAVCWVTLVHPLASDEQLALCESGWVQHIGYHRRYVCPRHQRLGASFFENITTLCAQTRMLSGAAG